MAYVTVATLQKIPQLNKLSTEFLSLLIGWAEKSINNYIKRNLNSATYTEYYNGSGTPDLRLHNYPVTAVSNLYIDADGYYGRKTGAFPATSELNEGESWVLEIDAYDGTATSKSGIIKRISTFGGSFIGTSVPFTPLVGSKLAADELPVWPIGYGNIKVVYTAGYTTIPADIEMAATSLCALMSRNVPVGGEITSESLGAYSYSISQADLKSPGPLGGIARALAPYRRLVI